METNRQKKIGSVLQKDLVDILQGEIRKNGTADVTTLILLLWALDTLIAPPSKTTKVVSFKVTLFMRFVLSWLGRTYLNKRLV